MILNFEIRNFYINFQIVILECYRYKYKVDLIMFHVVFQRFIRTIVYKNNLNHKIVAYRSAAFCSLFLPSFKFRKTWIVQIKLKDHS